MTCEEQINDNILLVKLRPHLRLHQHYRRRRILLYLVRMFMILDINRTFNLRDLLTATAETLGKGIAYYNSKEEKFVVYDYYDQGSVSVMLHSKIGEGRTPLDWETCLRIAIGTARGIAYIHTQTDGKLVHGNIKASNIFLNSQRDGCISKHGLTTLINQAVPPDAKIPGYRAPEVTNTSEVSQASDVYSYGVLLLELLTGKLLVYSTGRDEAYHLVRWVSSVIREEWTAEVFDIGMDCGRQRPKMTDVVKMAEDIPRKLNPKFDQHQLPIHLTAAEIVTSSIP
ncbi:hypothetical protein LguiA_002278 [Lonicera macranthoides]